MRFTFGKYAGYDLSDIPASYLALALEEFTIPDILHVQCRAELSRRFGLAPSTTVAGSAGGGEACGDKAKRIYRELAKRYHPDRIGGNTEAMQALNEYYESLTQST